MLSGASLERIERFHALQGSAKRLAADVACSGNVGQSADDCNAGMVSASGADCDGAFIVAVVDSHDDGPKSRPDLGTGAIAGAEAREGTLRGALRAAELRAYLIRHGVITPCEREPEFRRVSGPCLRLDDAGRREHLAAMARGEPRRLGRMMSAQERLAEQWWQARGRPPTFFSADWYALRDRGVAL